MRALATSRVLVILLVALSFLFAPVARAANFAPLFLTAEHYEIGEHKDGDPFRDGSSITLAVGDFNADGRPDIAAPNYWNGLDAAGSTVSVLYHTGDPDYSRMYGRWQNFPILGLAGNGVAVADFNLDGKDDMATSSSGGITVLKSTGSGFKARGFPVGDVRICGAKDLNGDTLPDVILLTTASAGISIMFAATGDSLGALTNLGAPFGASDYAPIVADATGDGIQDLVFIRIQGGSSIRIWKGNGSGSFSLSPVALPGSTQSQIVVANLNGDGLPDIVATDATGNVHVFLGAGGDTFQPPVDYGIGSLEAILGAGDVDADGDIDLVAIASTPHAEALDGISVLRNNGNGTFAPYTRYAGMPPVGSFVLADVDLDGRLDLVAAPLATGRTHTVNVLRNDGNGGFLGGKVNDPANLYLAEVVADFNRDGMPDVAIADSAAIRIGYGHGDGTYTSTVVATMPAPVYPTYPNCILAGDLDRDGWPDLVAATSTTAFQMFHNNGVAGTFTGSPPGYIGKLSTRSLVDMNKDGWLDLVYLDTAALSNVKVLLNFSGTFPAAPSSSTPLSFTAEAIVVADFNRDGNQDVIAAGQTAIPTTVQVLLGNGAGSLSNGTTLPTTRSYVDVCSGDFNRDGNPDLAARENVPFSSSTRGVDFWLGNGSGGFGAMTSLPTVEGSGRLIETWDANRDGALDLIAHGIGGPRGSVDLFIGSGNGNFGLRTTHSLGYSAGIGGSIAAGDVDRNGVNDLLVPDGSITMDPSPRFYTVPANPPSRGNGYQSTLFTQSLNNPGSVAVGDLNRDGKLDVVTAAFGVIPGVAVHLNTGQGVLGPVNVLSQSWTASKVQLADFNRDGILDIAASNAGFGALRVSIMLGVGNGTFGARNDYFVNAGNDFEVGDINRDGLLDIVTSVQDSIRVLLASPLLNGTFTAGVSVACPGAIGDLDLADLNRDGFLDVAVAAGTIRVLYGGAGGALSTPVTLVNPIANCSTLSVADFNRDGILDIQANQFNVLYLIWGANASPFSTYTTTTTAFTPFDVKVGEAEGNGEPYLFCSRNVEWLEVMKVNPDGTLANVGSYPITNSPDGLALGDMDRDGLVDAVTVGSGGSFVSVTLHGTSTITGVEGGAMPVAAAPATLHQNVPNPFNPTTEIRFTLRDRGGVRLNVYDVHGRLVTTLTNGLLPAGAHRVQWMGKNAHGESVASGVYFYRLTTAAGFMESKRMVLLK